MDGLETEGVKKINTAFVDAQGTIARLINKNEMIAKNLAKLIWQKTNRSTKQKTSVSVGLRRKFLDAITDINILDSIASHTSSHTDNEDYDLFQQRKFAISQISQENLTNNHNETENDNAVSTNKRKNHPDRFESDDSDGEKPAETLIMNKADLARPYDRYDDKKVRDSLKKMDLEEPKKETFLKFCDYLTNRALKDAADMLKNDNDKEAIGKVINGNVVIAQFLTNKLLKLTKVFNRTLMNKFMELFTNAETLQAIVSYTANPKKKAYFQAYLDGIPSIEMTQSTNNSLTTNLNEESQINVPPSLPSNYKTPFTQFPVEEDFVLLDEETTLISDIINRFFSDY